MKPMLTNNEIVEKSYDLIRKCVWHQINKFGTPMEYYDDLVQDISLILLNYDNEKMNQMYRENHINAFVTGCLVNSLYSVNSPFYRVYRRFRDLSNDVHTAYDLDEGYEARPKYGSKKEFDDDTVCVEDYNVTIEDTDFMKSVKESLDCLSIGELTIFLNYAESGNVSKLARQMKVPQALLNNYINQIKNKIKENITEREYDD